MPSDRIPVRSCDVRGKTCYVKDKKGKTWKHTAHSEAEADLLAEAVEQRGWITQEYWD